MTKTYRARPGSLPARLIDWFKANPEEELTRVDVAGKFGLAPSTVALTLEAAVKAGALAFERNDELEMVYRLPRPGDAPPTPPAPPAWPATSNSSPRRGQSHIEPPTPEELRALVVEKGRPVPKGGAVRGSQKWGPLVRLLDAPDTSLVLRPEWVSGVRRYTSTCNKRHKEAKEATRYYLGLDEDGAYRLWRTA